MADYALMDSPVPRFSLSPGFPAPASWKRSTNRKDAVEQWTDQGAALLFDRKTGKYKRALSIRQKPGKVGEYYVSVAAGPDCAKTNVDEASIFVDVEEDSDSFGYAVVFGFFDSIFESRSGTTPRLARVLHGVVSEGAEPASLNQVKVNVWSKDGDEGHAREVVMEISKFIQAFPPRDATDAADMGAEEQGDVEAADLAASVPVLTGLLDRLAGELRGTWASQATERRWRLVMGPALTKPMTNRLGTAPHAAMASGDFSAAVAAVEAVIAAAAHDGAALEAAVVDSVNTFGPAFSGDGDSDAAAEAIGVVFAECLVVLPERPPDTPPAAAAAQRQAPPPPRRRNGKERETPYLDEEDDDASDDSESGDDDVVDDGDDGDEGSGAFDVRRRKPKRKSSVSWADDGSATDASSRVTPKAKRQQVTTPVQELRAITPPTMTPLGAAQVFFGADACPALLEMAGVAAAPAGAVAPELAERLTTRYGLALQRLVAVIGDFRPTARPASEAEVATQSEQAGDMAVRAAMCGGPLKAAAASHAAAAAADDDEKIKRDQGLSDAASRRGAVRMPTAERLRGQATELGSAWALAGGAASTGITLTPEGLRDELRRALMSNGKVHAPGEPKSNLPPSARHAHARGPGRPSGDRAARHGDGRSHGPLARRRGGIGRHGDLDG
jgi:hypothetical protein